MGRKENIHVGADERAPKDHKLTRPGALTIVLLKPRIPQNTGAIARMCAATGSRLELVEPLFTLDDTKLKRAGLDYWPLLDVRVFPNWAEWEAAHPNIQPWLVEVGGPHVYTEAEFQKEAFICFGDEQDGIDPMLLARWPDKHLRIPQQGVRSMNQAMCVGIVSFEALRQIGWLGLK